MNVALTSYLLSLAVFIPVSGWMADRYGARSVFRAAIGVFTLGSILCGASTSLPLLVAARIVQGIGGAMMVPVGRLVLLRSVAKSELVAAMAWLTTPALIGPVVGPPLGGFLVTYADWRWIFYVNVPIGLAGMALVTRYVPTCGRPRPAGSTAGACCSRARPLPASCSGSRPPGAACCPRRPWRRASWPASRWARSISPMPGAGRTRCSTWASCASPPSPCPSPPGRCSASAWALSRSCCR